MHDVAETGAQALADHRQSREPRSSGVAGVQDRFGNQSVAGAMAGEWSGQAPLIAAEVALQAAGVDVSLVDGSNARLLQSWRHDVGNAGDDNPAMQTFVDRAQALGAGAFLAAPGALVPQGDQACAVG